MNNLLKYALGLFMFAFISCNKDNIDDTIKIDDPHTPEISVTNSLLTRSLTSAEGLEMGCFEVLYPFTLIDIDNNNYTISDEDDWNNLLQDSNLILIVDFIYPITISDSNGDETTIQNTDQLVEAFSTCTPTGGWAEGEFPAYNINESNSCYNIHYPISLESQSGSVVVATNEEELNTLLANELYFFDFPFQLEDETNAIITVNNVDELFNLLMSCNPGGGVDTSVIDWHEGFSYIGCYEIVFPVNVILADATGTTISINTEEQLIEIILSGQFYNFAFPLTVTDENGQTLVFIDENELSEALDDCSGITPGDFNTALLLLTGTLSDSTSTGVNEACYSINYPITVLAKAGGAIQTIVLNSDADLINVVLSGQYVSAEISYPISVTLIENNNTITINTDQELFDLLVNCN